MTSILKVTEIQDPTNSNTALEIDSSGYIKRGKNCAFLAYAATSATYNQNNILAWQYTDFNIDSCFDKSTGLFTAPVNGLYFFSFHTLVPDSSSYYVAEFRHSGMSTDIKMQTRSVSASNAGHTGASHVFSMNASETMGIYAYSSDYSNSRQDEYIAFSGYLISTI